MEYYSPKRVSDIFDLSYQTVLKMIKEGKLEAIKIGSQWRIPVEEVQKLESKFNESNKSD